MDCVETQNETQLGGASDAPQNKVPHGSIADYAAFKAGVNTRITNLAARRRSWASEESVELFIHIVDEYYAQLEDRPFDSDDLRELFNRYVNMNAVSNRLADSGLITRNPKGSRKVGSDLM